MCVCPIRLLPGLRPWIHPSNKEHYSVTDQPAHYTGNFNITSSQGSQENVEDVEPKEDRTLRGQDTAQPKGMELMRG